MVRRGRSVRADGASPVGKAIRRWFLLLGLGALFCGAIWTTASVARGPGELSEAQAFRSAEGVGAQCLTVRARRELEEESCFGTVYRELLEGRLDLRQAVARLESCGDHRPDLRAGLQRYQALRLEENRARVAFGELPHYAAAATHAAAVERLGSGLHAPDPRAVDRLRRAGIASAGLTTTDGGAVLARLRESSSLRRDFRDVFGSTTADDLDRLLLPTAADPSTPLRAVIVGNSVVVPNAPIPAAAGRHGAVPDPVVLTLPAYTGRVLDDLDWLEDTRLRYLASAAHAHRLTGSIGSFVSSLPTPAELDERSLAARRRAEADRSVMDARLRNLELQLGLDPVLQEMAREGVAFATDLSRACEAAALRRRSWVRTGAGVVTGLTGGAVIVAASGAVGTLIGGITIAAALEAAGGAYLIHRSERAGLRLAAARLPAPAEPVAVRAEERFREPDRSESVARGRGGTGRGEVDDPTEGGEWEEWDEAAGDGEGEEMDGEDSSTEPEPRTNRVPAVLPPPLPEQAFELPPMLSAQAVGDLRRLTLEEAQARLDEFLALEAPLRQEPETGPKPLASPAVSELIDEARAALALWVERRELSPNFGSFFLRAELEDLAGGARADALLRASERYSRDRAVWRRSASMEELRERVAERLVIHCRGGVTRGDLMLQACSDPTALTLVVVAAITDAGLSAPSGTVLGVQAQGADYHPVLYFGDTREVVSLASGGRTEGVVAPLYHPASFYYGFLIEHGVRPEIDPEEHLLIVAADAGAAIAAACNEPEPRNVLARMVDWARRLVGMHVPSRRGSACGAGPGDPPSRTAGSGGGGEQGSGVHVSIARPSVPMPGGGSQAGGGRGGGGGGGGGSEGGTPASAGGGTGSGESGASGGAREGARNGEGKSEGGASAGEGAGAGGGRDGRSGGQGAGGSGGAGNGASSHGGVEGGEATSRSEGGSGEAADAESIDLVSVGREAEELGRAAREDGALGLRPWRLRENHSFMPAAGRVLYADTELALSRFAPDDRFITMSPSQTEEQRRMFEAHSFRIFPTTTECSARGLPPRRVFRRATGMGDGFRYVYCDQDESIVAFRTRDEAAAYARLGAPDRPLLLTRLASERIAAFEANERVATVNAILRDPEIIRSISVAELDSLNSTVGELLWFQERLEAALFRSMAELEGSTLRAFYYDLHRQVAQSPFILDFAEAVYRFNRRLASDPLRTLAWANALPPEHRQRFFRLYFTLGTAMYWPDRWEALHRRYAEGEPPSPTRTRNADEPSLDFLQVMSDPTRVHVDWPDERPPRRPSIRDVRVQEGRESTEREETEPTDVEERDREERRVRRRGGTGGLGRTGEGEGLGPERGRRPLQMIHIRVKPEMGDPDRPRLPENNPTRPGGTEGRKKVQERSASRQEPALWVSPETFVDAILSGWDPPRVHPGRSDRIPPVVRFSPRLRALFLARPYEDKLYDGRLYHAVTVLTSGGWLRYAEVREAMGGAWSGVRAYDNGRFALEYSMTAPIVDQDQVGGPNFFTETGVDIPAELLPIVQRIFSRDGSGTFDLHVLSAQEPVVLPPPDAGSLEAAAARVRLRRSLQMIAEQAGPRN